MTVALGCNYSAPLLQLLARQAVDVDWIKLSQAEVVDEELAITRPLRPVLLHMLPSAGSRPAVWSAYPWPALERQLQYAGSPHIALHFDLWPQDWDDPLAPEAPRPEQVEAIWKRLTASIRAVQEHVRVPVLVENSPYYGAGGDSWGGLRLLAQPETLWQMTGETGAGLLLDASHLRCAAQRLGGDTYAYARALPLHAVREIHVVSPLDVPGRGLRDRHQPMREEDYALLAWLLERTTPQVVTLEYGGIGPHFERRNDPQALQEQLTRLRAFLAGA
jgi:uncharacterized protein